MSSPAIRLAADSEFKIEKGVPLSKSLQGSLVKAKYPWEQMEVGDSFFAPLSSYDCRSGTPTVEKYLAVMRRLITSRREGAFRVRREGQGLRVWRVG